MMAVFSAVDDGLCVGARYIWMRAGVIERLFFAQHGVPISVLAALYLRTVFNYAQIAAVGWALHYQRVARQKEVQTSQLETRLVQAHLDALRMQMHPHFLFNTLNSIAALMHSDLAAAERMIARLGELLRYSLTSPAGQESSVKEELDLTERYLDIERVRFGDRLHVTVNVGADALDACVRKPATAPKPSRRSRAHARTSSFSMCRCPRWTASM